MESNILKSYFRANKWLLRRHKSGTYIYERNAGYLATEAMNKYSRISDELFPYNSSIDVIKIQWILQYAFTRSRILNINYNYYFLSLHWTHLNEVDYWTVTAFFTNKFHHCLLISVLIHRLIAFLPASFRRYDDDLLNVHSHKNCNPINDKTATTTDLPILRKSKSI